MFPFEPRVSTSTYSDTLPRLGKRFILEIVVNVNCCGRIIALASALTRRSE